MRSRIRFRKRRSLRRLPLQCLPPLRVLQALFPVRSSIDRFQSQRHNPHLVFYRGHKSPFLSCFLQLLSLPVPSSILLSKISTVIIGGSLPRYPWTKTRDCEHCIGQRVLPNSVQTTHKTSRFNIMYTNKDANFDRITHLAKLIFQTRSVAISLIDGVTQ